MKKFLYIVAIFIISLSVSASTVSANAPIRIARLPIITADKLNVSSSAVSRLDLQLERALHVPLNGYLKRVENIPADQSHVALNEILLNLRNKNKNAVISDAMKPLAEQLNADVVVCAFVYRFRQMTTISSGWHSGSITHLRSDAAVELIIYDNRTGELTDKKTSRFYNDDYSSLGTAEALASDCLDRLIYATNLRDRVLNQSEKQ